MVRSSGISATKPVFPAYLLPSFNFGFRRRSSASTSSSLNDSGASTPATTPNNSPPKREPLSDHMKAAAIGAGSPRRTRISRVAPDTLRCSTCSADLAFASQIISKGFTGRYGRAFLVSPPALQAEQSLLNIRVGRSENRQLVTGWHVVADISCSTCTMKLGWKYVDAKEASQKYKVGKFILETERVVTYRSWEDVPEEVVLEAGSKDAADDEAGGEELRRRSDSEEDEVVFDSGDDEECEDIFAGTWNAGEVAKRRVQTMAARASAENPE